MEADPIRRRNPQPGLDQLGVRGHRGPRGRGSRVGYVTARLRRLDERIVARLIHRGHEVREILLADAPGSRWVRQWDTAAMGEIRLIAASLRIVFVERTQQPAIREQGEVELVDETVSVEIIGYVKRTSRHSFVLFLIAAFGDIALVLRRAADRTILATDVLATAAFAAVRLFRVKGTAGFARHRLIQAAIRRVTAHRNVATAFRTHVRPVLAATLDAGFVRACILVIARNAVRTADPVLLSHGGDGRTRLATYGIRCTNRSTATCVDEAQPTRAIGARYTISQAGAGG